MDRLLDDEGLRHENSHSYSDYTGETMGEDQKRKEGRDAGTITQF